MTGTFSRIPSVDRILTTASGKEAVIAFGHSATVDMVRAMLADERILIQMGSSPRDAVVLASAALKQLEAEAVPSLRPVFNLTGTVLHTNLGRAQLPEAAVQAAIAAMRHAVTLEYDLDHGGRGERDDHLRTLVCELTGAEDATVVNNNAAAVLLVLNTLAGQGQGAIISRGEMIEIGGAFRMPDIMMRAGADLVEVGTTNRTHKGDYIRAIDENSALILKVHTSNYVIDGFTKTVTTKELAEIAAVAGLPLVEDLGSGTFVDLAGFGLAYEPTVQDSVKAGADIITFSGDKLLGGPQAGFIIGKADLIAKINRNPMKRSLRIDKIRVAALEAVLKLYKSPENLCRDIPTLRFLTHSADRIRALAEALVEPVQALLGKGFLVDVITCRSEVGSGASPVQTLPSAGLGICAADGAGCNVGDLVARMRALPVPVIGRIRDNMLHLDLRTLEETELFLANLRSLEA